jgi:Protein of unknown function (DUF3551)
MRLIVVLGAVLAAGAFQARPAMAETYPWCAVDMQEGMWTCAFADRQQCMQAASGVGAYCTENPNDHPRFVSDPRPKRSKARR